MWLVAKAFVAAAWTFLRAVPWQAWAAIAVAAGVWYYGHTRFEAGEAEAQAKCAVVEKARLAKIAELEARSAKVVVREVVVYRDVVKTIKGETRDIIREIPVLVHAPCAWPGSIRVLHDAAAAGQLPGDPAGASAAADPVEASALVETVAENYGFCRADQARLLALQNILAGIR